MRLTEWQGVSETAGEAAGVGGLVLLSSFSFLSLFCFLRYWLWDDVIADWELWEDRGMKDCISA